MICTKNLYLVLTLTSFQLFAQEVEQTLSPQSTVILPWATAGMDPSITASSRPQLEAARIQLINAVLQKPKSLLVWMQEAKYPLGVKPSDDFLTSSQIGQSKLSQFHSQTMEPWLCASGNIYILAIIASNYESGYHYKIDHIVIRKSIFNDLIRENKLGGDLFQRFQQILSSLNTYHFDNKSILKLDLKLLNETHGDRLGSNQCLNLLVLQLLQEKFNFVPQGNRLAMGRLQHYFTNVKTSRPNRVLHIQWLRTADPFPKNSDNSQISFNLRISDSVFGRFLPEVYKQKGSFNLSDHNNLTMEHLNEVTSYLEKEARILTIDQAPKIIKIYGAWAYLDKGRAWGLHPRDRLVGNESSQIKAHVIGYFGPEQMLKNAEGENIYEGAIVFVRSGVPELKVGQSFTFDPTVYPH